MLDPTIVEELKRPIDASRVATFSQGPSRGAKYLESWDVIERANEIFGYAGWSSRVVEKPFMVEAGSSSTGTPYEVWACIVEVRVGDAVYSDIGTNVRSGTGAPGLEMAFKGAASDGVKRCLRFLGNQFGLSLYDKADPLDQGDQRPPQGQQGRPNLAASATQRRDANPNPNEDARIGAIRAHINRLGGDAPPNIVKEAISIALGISQADLTPDTLAGHVIMWLTVNGNTPTKFERTFSQALEELGALA